MNIENNNYEIRIIINKCTNETIQIFIKDYMKLYSELEKEKKYKLIFIQNNDIDISSLTILGLVLYNKFKTIHRIYIKNIVFMIKDNIVKKILDNALELYPPREPYEIVFLEKSLSELKLK